MNESTFSALRIVAMMIGVDGEVHPTENQWFLNLVKKYRVTEDQMAIFTKDLNDQSGLELILAEVRKEDRAQLLSWLNMFMQLDRKNHSKEKIFFDKVVRLLSMPSPKDLSVKDYASLLLDQHNEIQMWSELKEMGNFMNSRIYRRPFGSRAYDGYGRPTFYNFLSIRKKNALVWFIVIVVFLFFILDLMQIYRLFKFNF